VSRLFNARPLSGWRCYMTTGAWTCWQSV
jgi:hypothetical protein